MNYLAAKHRGIILIKKELHLNLGDALSLADEDIKENWKSYKTDFLEGK